MQYSHGVFLWGSTIPTDELAAQKLIFRTISPWYTSVILYEHCTSVWWILTAQKLIEHAIFTCCMSVGIDDPHGCTHCTKINFSHQVRLWRVRESLQRFRKTWLRFRVRGNPNHTCCLFVGIDDPQRRAQCTKINFECNICLVCDCSVL